MKFPFRRDLVGIYVRDKVQTYAEIKIGVKELERGFFIHGAHAKLLPLVSDAHRTQLDWRDANTGEGRQGTITGKFGGRRRGR